QEHRSEDRNDRDDHKQLDEGKGPEAAFAVSDQALHYRLKETAGNSLHGMVVRLKHTHRHLSLRAHDDLADMRIPVKARLENVGGFVVQSNTGRGSQHTQLPRLPLCLRAVMIPAIIANPEGEQYDRGWRNRGFHIEAFRGMHRHYCHTSWRSSIPEGQ